MKFGLSVKEWQNLPRQPFSFSVDGRSFTVSVDREEPAAEPAPAPRPPRATPGRVTAAAVEKRRTEQRERIDALLSTNEKVTVQQAARAAKTNPPGASAILLRGAKQGRYKRNADKTWSLIKPESGQSSDAA